MLYRRFRNSHTIEMLPKEVTDTINNAVGEKTGKPLSDSSKRTYTSNLKRLLRDSKSDDFFDMVKDVTKTTDTISKNTNIHSRLGQLSAINMLFARVPSLQSPSYSKARSKYLQIQKQASELYEKGREQNKLTNAQSGKYMSINDLRDIFFEKYESFLELNENQDRSISDSNWRLFLKRLLILGLYVLHPPVRQDYGCIRLYKTKKIYNTNHILLCSNTLVLTEYKTSETYGRVESVLPPEVINVLNASLIAEPRQWLFIKSSDKPYSHSSKDTNSFSVLVNRSLSEIVGKPIDVTSIRRAYTTWLAEQTLTFAERRRIAEIMGHSVIQSLKYQVVDSDTQNGTSNGMVGGGSGSASGIKIGDEIIHFSKLTPSERSSVNIARGITA
jgi:hypothetical protein